MQSSWPAYERFCNEVYPRALAARSHDEAVLRRMEETAFPLKSKLPARGGLLFVDSRYGDIMSKAASKYPVTHLRCFDPQAPPAANDIKEVNLLKWRHDLWHIIAVPETGSYLLQLLLDEVMAFLERLSPQAGGAEALWNDQHPAARHRGYPKTADPGACLDSPAESERWQEGYGGENRRNHGDASGLCMLGYPSHIKTALRIPSTLQEHLPRCRPCVHGRMPARAPAWIRLPPTSHCAIRRQSCVPRAETH